MGPVAGADRWLELVRGVERCNRWDARAGDVGDVLLRAVLPTTQSLMAALCGFQNERTFCAVFEKKFGCTPGA